MGTYERVFSHVALSVGRGDGPLAARLLSSMGLDVTDNGPSLQGDPWYTAVIDPTLHAGKGLRHLGFFVVPASDEQLRLESALCSKAADEVATFAAAKWGKPDSNAHVALNFSTIGAIEGAVRAIRADDEVAERVEVRAIRPESAPPELDERLDRSDVFADALRVRYLSSGVQVFLSTDLVSAGLLCLRQSFELNHETTDMTDRDPSWVARIGSPGAPDVLNLDDHRHPKAE